MAFVVEKMKRMWYNCVDVEWEIQNVVVDLFV